MKRPSCSLTTSAGARAGASESPSAAKNIFWLNSVLVTMTMLAVLTSVISSHAVYAAQRDSFKPKEPHANSINNNANVIAHDISIAGSSSSSSSAITSAIGSGGNGGGGGGINSSNDGRDVNVGSSRRNGNGVSYGNSNNISNDSRATGSTNAASGASTATTTTTSTSSSALAKPATASIATSTASATTSSSSSSSGGSSSGSGSSNSNNNNIGGLQKTNNMAAAKSFSSNRNSLDAVDETRTDGPYFDKAASKNVTALLGKTAYLNCRVRNLGNKTMLLQVSWVRHRDVHLLTVGRYTYTSDQRFRALHQPQTEDWSLQIKYPQHRDSGIYECQVSTTPHMSHYIHLNVVEPSTQIMGAPDLYIESGSTINLTCVILNSPEPPAYIFWNHNNAIINYDSPRGGVSVITNKGETTTSFLLIKSAKPLDSGHYQCNPSNSKPKSVTVHVLNGKFPAAIQRAGQALHRMPQSYYLLVYLLMYLFTLGYVGRFMRLPAKACKAR